MHISLFLRTKHKVDAYNYVLSEYLTKRKDGWMLFWETSPSMEIQDEFSVLCDYVYSKKTIGKIACEEACILHAEHTHFPDTFTPGHANEISLLDPLSWMGSYFKVVVWVYLGHPYNTAQ